MKAFLLALFCGISIVQAQSQEPEYYELTVYHFTKPEQEKAIDQYLDEALLPALHRLGISAVGVFKPLSNDTAADKTIYCLVPVKSLAQAIALPGKLEKDKIYTKDRTSFWDAPWDKPAFTRKEVSHLKAFALAPHMQKPALTSPKADHIYEFRSYESASEKLYRNKVHMFNEGGEIPLFKRLGFNAIFYAEVVAGSRMPNLVYMTSFENREERDLHWKTFSADPEWKKLSSLPFYQKNVSKADIILMKAATYSDY